ncbi:MAG: FAD-dependent oxidoreductase [Candidatus Bathyarchaeia archaeon]
MRGKNSILVIGGGIAGIQASLDLANRGFEVYLVERNPSIGGKIAQLDCSVCTLELPLDCSICPLRPKMIESYYHQNIKLLTYSEVKEIAGSAGDFKTKILRSPRFVEEERCTGCRDCIKVCPVEVPNEFDMGLGMRKAVYMPFPQAVPPITIIDKDHCLYFLRRECRECEKVCQANATAFDQEPEEVEVEAKAIILATGFDLFDPSTIKEYGYKMHENVITTLEFERLSSVYGPTRGKLIRPSDKTTPDKVAFIHCVGSRSIRLGTPFCSGICCMYTVKDANLVKIHEPKTDVYVFYMDLRVFGKGYQEFINKAVGEWGINYIRGRPGGITEDPQTKDLTIWYEDTLSRKPKTLTVNLVVLCPALLPHPSNRELAEILGVELDEYGFFKSPNPLTAPVDTTVPGILTCGYSRGPKGISESAIQGSAAAARASEMIALMKRGEA